MVDNTQLILETQIAKLYDVFSRYTVQHPISSVTKEMQDKLASKPLRLLTGTDLDRFTFHAMSTWGTVEDFKHFLPRILELLALEPRSFGLVWPGLVFDLMFSHSIIWTEAEKQTIDAYLRALLEYILAIFPSRSIRVGDFIGGIRDIDPYLSIWQTHFPEKTAVYHLVDLIDWQFDILNSGFGIIKRKPQALLSWLQHSDKKLLLEQAFFEDIDNTFSEQISWASKNLSLLTGYTE